MVRAILGAALLLGLAGPVWAQDQETINKAIGKEMQVYMNCVRSHAENLARSSEAVEIVAERAIEACVDERHAVWIKMQEPPLNASPGEATAAIEQSLDAVRPQIIKTVREVRL